MGRRPRDYSPRSCEAERNWKFSARREAGHMVRGWHRMRSTPRAAGRVLGEEYVPAAEVGQQAAAKVDGAREAPRHDHVAAPIERDAGRPVLTRTPEALRPQGHSTR